MTWIELITLMAKYILLPVASALAGAGIKVWLEDRRFFKLDSTREISGNWRGELRYTKPRWDPESVEFEFYSKPFFSLNYWLNSKIVTGVIRSGNDRKEDLQIQGGFYQPDQLMLDYRSVEKNRRQFGSVVLELDASGHSLKGNFIGHFNEPVAGTLALEKTDR